MRFSLLLAALPLVFFVGCSDDALPFSTCGSAADCATGYTCTNNFCVQSEGRGGPSDRDTGTGTESDSGTNPGLDVGGSDTSTGSDVATLDVPVSEDTGGECVPNCSGLECGEDGCGGSCGFCAGTETCVSGRCQGGGGGGIDCPDVIGCINESDGTQAGFDACLAQGTPAAQNAAIGFYNCGVENCADAASMDEFLSCAEASCPAESAECDAN